MAQITLKGTPIHTLGHLPNVGSDAPDFSATSTDLSDRNLSDVGDKTLVLNIFPSVDTGTCAASVRRFNQELNALEKVEVWCLSADLPFALQRFCGAEGLAKVTPLSVFRHPELGEAYGVRIEDGPLKGLMARSVVVIKAGKVVYTELVSETVNEPNYEAALVAIKG